VIPINEQVVMVKGSDDPAVTVADELTVLASHCPQDRGNAVFFRVGPALAARDSANTQGIVSGLARTVAEGNSVCGWNSVRFTNTLLRHGSLIACMLACICLAGCGTDLASPHYTTYKVAHQLVRQKLGVRLNHELLAMVVKATTSRDWHKLPLRGNQRPIG